MSEELKAEIEKFDISNIVEAAQGYVQRKQLQKGKPLKALKSSVAMWLDSLTVLDGLHEVCSHDAYRCYAVCHESPF